MSLRDDGFCPSFSQRQAVDKNFIFVALVRSRDQQEYTYHQAFLAKYDWGSVVSASIQDFGSGSLVRIWRLHLLMGACQLFSYMFF
jgi:hypothetical protein